MDEKQMLDRQKINRTALEASRLQKGVNEISQLMMQFDSRTRNMNWLVDLCPEAKKIEGSLIGQAFVVQGPAYSGKTSLIYWALKEFPEVHVIQIDCQVYKTDLQFIKQFTKDIGEKLHIESIDTKLAITQKIKFSEFNSLIIPAKKEFVLIIRNAEGLVNKKQLLLYNLLQWLNSEIRNYFGIVLVTKTFTFVSKLQKRVRSRLSANFILVMRPNNQKPMIEMLARRIDCLMGKEQRCSNLRFKKVKTLKLSFLEKVRQAITANKKFAALLRTYLQRDIVSILNCMKSTLSRYESVESVIEMSDHLFHDDICKGFKEGEATIFPSIQVSLLKNCSFPEHIVMAVIYHMGVNELSPIRFKTIYSIYLDLKNRMIDAEGIGTSFAYSQKILLRAVQKLEEIHVLRMENQDEAFQNNEIASTISPDNIRQAFSEISNVPQFIRRILD